MDGSRSESNDVNNTIPGKIIVEVVAGLKIGSLMFPH